MLLKVLWLTYLAIHLASLTWKRVHANPTSTKPSLRAWCPTADAENRIGHVTVFLRVAFAIKSRTNPTEAKELIGTMTNNSAGEFGHREVPKVLYLPHNLSRSFSAGSSNLGGLTGHQLLQLTTITSFR